MKLSNGARAIVDIEKLRGYCLNAHHPRGRNKARVFASVGIRETDAHELRLALLASAVDGDAQSGMLNSFGQRYVIDFEWSFQGRRTRIRSSWIVLVAQDLPRLTTCYVL